MRGRRAQRDRRALAGFNTRLGRDLGDQEHARRSPAAAGVARAAARVAHGRRAHRPAFERAGRLRGEPQVPQGCRSSSARSPATATRSFTTCPGRLYGDLRGIASSVAASACRSSICPKSGGAGSVRQLLGQALDCASLDGDHHRHRRKAGRAGLWVRDERPSGPGTRASPRCPATAGESAPVSASGLRPGRSGPSAARRSSERCRSLGFTQR